MRFLLLLCLSFWPCLLWSQQLSPLAEAPRWEDLECFQETMTREEFVRLLQEVYAPANAARGLINVGAKAATVRKTLTTPETWALRFAQPGQQRAVPTSWRAAATLGAAPEEKPLLGVKIALDPGHLGGEWARMEERFFHIGPTVPVQEGNLTLQVAQKLAPQLQALGAEVSMVRSELGPVTPVRPGALQATALLELAARGYSHPLETYAGKEGPRRAGSVQNETELLFYRTAEIHARAKLVNEHLRPDLTVCLHFNADAWGDPQYPTFVPGNHLHLLVNGAYSAAELRRDDVRFEMLWKLLSRIYPEERAAGEAIAASLAAATGLPPYTYSAGSAVAVPGSGYLWARNLLANRLYHCPVIYLEPYVMNNEAVWERVQLGDYEGTILLHGIPRKSLVREYADSVAAGLRTYYQQARSAQP